MNFQAIEHQSDSLYSYPLDGNRYRIVIRTMKGDSIKKISCLWASFNLFYKERKEETMELIGNDHYFSYYGITIGNGNPGYAYVFLIEENDGKKYYYSEAGFEESYDFARAYLGEFMAPFPNELDIIKENKDFEGRLFYQIFPERFARGSKEKKEAYINESWDNPHPNNLKFCGGDFEGIKEKLPYLASIGVGAIYLNPIHPSPSAHKYDVNDYFEIDPMFGDKASFLSLVEEAHRHDIKIVMDLVFNHCCFHNGLFQDVVKNGKKSPYYDWFFIDGDKPTWEKGNYLTFANVKMMPKLNTNNPETMDYLCKVGEYWLKEAKVDGYRLDVAFDVSHAFWREFRERCLAINPTCLIIGEQWLNSFSRLGSSEWDSVMNYPIRLALERYFVKKVGGNEWLAEEINGLLMRYRENTNRMLMNLLDSHDIERFFNTLSFSKDKLLCAFAILFFHPGLPCLYMGDEIFMKGLGDPDNRKCMEWNSDEFDSPEGILFKKLTLMRKNDILKKGDWKISTKDGAFMIKRDYMGHSLTLLVNEEEKEIPLNGYKIILSNGLKSNKLVADSFAIIEE